MRTVGAPSLFAAGAATAVSRVQVRKKVGVRSFTVFAVTDLVVKSSISV